MKSQLSSTIIKDSAGRQYRVVQEMCFHVDTPDRVIYLLIRSYQDRTRLRFHYGDVITGKAWGDVETGHVGRSTGTIKIPLVIKNSRSFGGGGLLDNAIVKIEYANKKQGAHPLYDITK